MTDQEINRKLAQAIGWKPKQIEISNGEVLVRLDLTRRWDWTSLRVMNFMDWRVIGPIAQRYDCFPFGNGNGWCAYAESVSRSVYSDTPQQAIALAVIAAYEAGVLK